MFKKFYVTALVIGIFISISIQNLMAESYRYEATAGYSYVKSDMIKTNVYLLEALVNFSEVELGSVPYIEAAYFQKTGYFVINGTFGSFNLMGDKMDMTVVNPELKLVAPVVPVFVMLGYQYQKLDSNAGVDSTLHGFNADLGYYIIDGLAAAFTFQTSNSKTSSNTDKNAFGGYIKYVIMLENKISLNIKGTYDNSSSKAEGESKEINNVYAAEADFYFTPKIGIGCGFGFNKGDDKTSAGKTYTARASYFFTMNVGLNAEFSIFKAQTDGSLDSKNFTVMLTGRI